MDGDLLALDGLGAGAGFQDLLLESHLAVLRVSSPKFGGGAALVWWLLIGGGASVTYISGYSYHLTLQRAHGFSPKSFPSILSRP